MIPELLGGLPREVYPSPFKLSSVLFYALPPFWAYVTLEIAVRSLLIAAAFATLPFYVMYDASVAGQPLVALAFLDL